ncbi:tyrosine--tRNA ligase [Candidatus Jorgensenbacteria bacterium RIFCSPLOWO2_01_FULL_45_25b]|uniref:Tyrosine--tRNA ligase n=2 Tax=Parcubacteria group TaxID=1794811 RepID=A0A1F6BUE6_9BACT|nr:MAG: tyrosine--tRNA ligase [Candidatus Azambacteria bacterium RIFCSPHIGHO2_01_FULL_40_24]OGG40458.1 MAG: tyrosine--tRNA ligase [Candidatus Jorgensenbacteria bacterium RIFCSPLOWO2_01_FULL_45_25b]
MDNITHLLTRNVDTVIEREHLKKALESGKKLRIKHGVDPTGEHIHIGRAIVLWKLKEFQELGHKIILIIGDFTAQIGDPSDKLEKRPFLTKTQIKQNLENYLPQIGKILDIKKTEVRYNSEWLGKLNFQEISELADHFTLQQMIERNNFKERWNKHEPISVRETLYPLMQGYDSVAIKADIELGGTDQLFNMLAGRKIQERYNQKPQDIITTNMLSGTDGRKMSTSWGNIINTTDNPNNMFGKVMASNDDVMIEYFTLTTDLDEEIIKNYKEELKNGANPRDIKEILALEITTRYHGKIAAEKAREEFIKTFRDKETPENIPPLKLSTLNLQLINLLMEAGVPSKGEARRLIEQKGVQINDKVKTDSMEIINLKPGDVLQIGKRRFFRIN